MLGLVVQMEIFIYLEKSNNFSGFPSNEMRYLRSNCQVAFNISYNIKVTGCLSVSLCVTQVLGNRCADMVLVYSEAYYRSREKLPLETPFKLNLIVCLFLPPSSSALKGL